MRIILPVSYTHLDVYKRQLHNDMNQLVQKWETAFKNIQKNKVPSKVLSEEDKASAILRDNFNADFVSIICDDEQMVNDMKNYIEVIAPERKNIVQFYDRPTPLLEYYNAVSYTHLDVYKRQLNYTFRICVICKICER